MKKVFLSVAILFTSLASFAQKWTVDQSHSKVGFTVTHLMLSEVDGNFKKFDASITSAKEDFTDAVFTLSIDVNSVDTDNEMRDKHLKGADYFDVEKFPKINFTSKSITKIDAKNYNMNGALTMHGVTKPISLKLVLNGVGKNMRTQKPLAGFKVTGTINRKDFGVSNAPGAMLSEDIEIRAVGEFNKE